MKLPSGKILAINIGAGSVMLAAFISFVHSSFARQHVEVCSTRYPRQLTMQLDRDGVPLTAPELQGVSNGQDEGLLENLSVAQFQQGPSKFAMGVKIAKGTVEQRSTRGVPGGVSMPWMPSVIEQPAAACLSYNVFLPADFKFGQGGTLPGFFGTTTNGSFSDVPFFGSSLAWQSDGVPKFHLITRAPDDNRNADFKTYAVALPVGRWVRVDQELVLNQPDHNDGIARLWLDGKIEAEVKNVDLRPSLNVAISGVAGDVYYGGSSTNGVAPDEATIWLTPFELRWK